MHVSVFYWFPNLKCPNFPEMLVHKNAPFTAHSDKRLWVRLECLSFASQKVPQAFLRIICLFTNIDPKSDAHFFIPPAWNTQLIG
jgi:hypothetical protein